MLPAALTVPGSHTLHGSTALALRVDASTAAHLPCQACRNFSNCRNVGDMDAGLPACERTVFCRDKRTEAVCGWLSVVLAELAQ